LVINFLYIKTALMHSPHFYPQTPVIIVIFVPSNAALHKAFSSWPFARRKNTAMQPGEKYT